MASRSFVTRPLLLLVLGAGVALDALGDTAGFTIGMAHILDQQGQRIATDALFELVDLGTNGVFDPIPAGKWVGGDDLVITESFSNSDGWASTAAFDLTDGVGTTGVFSRQFTLTLGTGVVIGTKIGIRWFPTVKASDYATTQTTGGLPYGQFTRQASPRYGGTLWRMPAGMGFNSFDPLLTPSYDSVNGQDANSLGMASAMVTPVPEPQTSILVMLGCVYAIGFGKRCVRRSP